MILGIAPCLSTSDNNCQITNALRDVLHETTNSLAFNFEVNAIAVTATMSDMDPQISADAARITKVYG